MVLAIILVLLWTGAAAFNAFFATDRVLDHREDGVSPIPIIGSLAGVIAILLAPFWTLAERLILLPLGLLPDLIPLIEWRIHAWRRRRGRAPRQRW